jgi:hypothetical protein
MGVFVNVAAEESAWTEDGYAISYVSSLVACTQKELGAD